MIVDLLALVVARDRDIDVTERRISVGERDDRDVDVRRLQYRLVVGQRVGDDQQARLEELLLDL